LAFDHSFLKFYLEIFKKKEGKALEKKGEVCYTAHAVYKRLF
jgi:hypothetical protein